MNVGGDQRWTFGGQARERVRATGACPRLVGHRTSPRFDLDSLGIPFDGAGSWLLEDDVTEVALEPDETFVLHDVRKQRPDLAIEVVWTSGGVSKLAIYRHLQIGEVWIWKDDVLTFYVLGESGYEEREHSACVPGFDKQLAYDMLELEALSDVRRALRERLRR